jgi:1,4-dihydroxy-2-naphthoyl-CoA hydrolase
MSVPEPDMSPFCRMIGVEWLSLEPEEARARIEVRDEIEQPYGYLHGGVIMTMVDELCSRSTVMKVVMDEMIALGQSMEISLLRSIPEGAVTVTARVRHRGKSTWVWDAEATDSEGRLCALAKATVAIRPLQTTG